MLWPPKTKQQTVSITFCYFNKNENVPCAQEFMAAPGDTLLQVANSYDIPLEGACGGSLACATCHVVLDQAFFNTLAEKTPAKEAEEDMLDIAKSLTNTSRLGCQLYVSEAYEGQRILIPNRQGNLPYSPLPLAKPDEAEISKIEEDISSDEAEFFAKIGKGTSSDERA